VREIALWAAGLTMAAIWSVVNFSLVIRIIKIAVLKEPKTNLRRILMIKFPALYLAGFWILNSRIFPTASILTGMGLALVLIGVVTVWPKPS
jgi:hypothetical protein